MKLLHCFPRRRSRYETVAHSRGLVTLESIIRHGFICTPERLEIPIANHWNALRRRQDVDAIGDGVRHSQSRCCFTLCEPPEIYEPKVRGLQPGAGRPIPLHGAVMSHADLFGPYALVIDPVRARQLGIAPVKYFTRSDISGRRYDSNSSLAAGFDAQMLQRLIEIRDLGVVLAYLENSLSDDGTQDTKNESMFPDADTLELLNIMPLIDSSRFELTRRAQLNDRINIIRHFWTDRVRGIDIVSFVDMILGLFQETDSKDGTEILAFYEQREWRLVYHSRDKMVWYSLGDWPSKTNPNRKTREDQVLEIKDLLKFTLGRSPSSEYLKGCWVFEHDNGVYAKEFIEEIIVPSVVLNDVRILCQRERLDVRITAAETYGYKEKL